MSLRNRTAGWRGWQNVCVWQTWQGYNLHVMSWSSLSIHVFWFLQKDLFKGKWFLAKSYFKQNCCHGCHTRFAVFFPLPSCCVSSLIFYLRYKFLFFFCFYVWKCMLMKLKQKKKKLREIKKLLQHIHGWLTLVKLITAACSFRSQSRNHRKCIIKKCNPYCSHLTGIMCMKFTSLLITR